MKAVKKTLALIALFLLFSGCLQPQPSSPSPSPTSVAEPSFSLPTPKVSVRPSPSPRPTPRATPVSRDLIPENYTIPDEYDAIPCANSSCVNAGEECKIDFNFEVQPNSCCAPDYCLWQGWCWGEYDSFLNTDDHYDYYCLNGSWTPVEKK
ncbi:MAG: hypothetical protein V1834_04190 [Candidatus Micrarchaeota archaeon]